MNEQAVSVVIPTVEGREELLQRAVAGFSMRGLEPWVVRGHGRLGAGWQRGIEEAPHDLVWLAADDVYPYWPLWAPERFQVAVERADAGLVVCPILYWDNGSLQGAGGHGDELGDGATARSCAFPFAHRDTFGLIGDLPPFNHHVDSWITARARELDRGPVVTAGAALVHSVLSDDDPDETAEYEVWLRAGARV